MIESSKWYASSGFWGPASGVIAVIAMGVIAAWIAWRTAYPRKRLIYKTSEPTPLVSSHPFDRSSGELTITYNGMELKDPYSVTLEVVSHCRKDIRSSDFDNGSPLVFDFGTPITAVIGPVENMAGVVYTMTNSVELSPCLIRRGKLLRMNVLTEGTPALTCRNPLVDIEVEPYIERKWKFTLEARPAVLSFLIMTWLALSIGIILLTNVLTKHG